MIFTRQTLAWLAIGIVLCPAIARAYPSTAGVVGLWRSSRTFGPTIQESGFVVSRKSGTWLAQAVGGSVEVRSSASPVFDFGGGNALVVHADGSDLVGQWIQSATVGTGYRFATPVRFVKGIDGKWRGRIAPVADVQRADLFVRQDAAGALTAFIRNPEQNFGARIGSRTVSQEGNRLTLAATGQKSIIGTLDPVDRTLSMSLDFYPGKFVFRKTPGPGVSSIPTTYEVPVQTEDGWHTGTLTDAGIDLKGIQDVLYQLSALPTSTRSPYIQSLLIARHGKLVLDAYFDGYDRTMPHDVRSAGKSVATLLVGAAIEDGAKISPATRVDALFPKYLPFANDDPRKHNISLGDLMSMSTGLACDDNDDNSPGLEDTMQSQTKQPDWYKFTLDLPMVSDPGTKAAYCSATINLLGGVISNATARWLPDYFYERFARPMQFGRYGMWLTPSPLNTAYMAGGDYFLPRDFLKFGQLFLDRGRWNGAQILDNAWLQASVQPHSSLNGPNDYGYGWHLLTYVVNGQTYRAFNAGGNGGQLLIVIPRLDTAIMITAANYGQYPVWQGFVNDLVPKRILSAIRT